MAGVPTFSTFSQLFPISIKKLRGGFSDGNTSNSKDFKSIVSSNLKNDIRLFKEFAKELIEDKADAFKIVNR